MRRMYVPSRWLAEFMDDRNAKYYRYTKFPLTDEDVSRADIRSLSSQYKDIGDLRGVYAYYRDVLINHASCAYPELSETSLQDRQRLILEILKMEPGVKMLRYRSFLMMRPNYFDSRETFEIFLARHDSLQLDHVGYEEPVNQEATGTCDQTETSRYARRFYR